MDSAPLTRDAFMNMVRANLPSLMDAAARELAYREATGELSSGQLTEVDLIAETLFKAWRSRKQKPDLLEPRIWLIGLMHATAEVLVAKEAESLPPGLLSIEEVIHEKPAHDPDADFWEWFQPDEVLRREDQIPDATSLPQEREEIALRSPSLQKLTGTPKEAAVLHLVHKLEIVEVAQFLQLPLQQVRDDIQKAHWVSEPKSK
ncbi:hypothetical protein [Novosphingobium sp. PC22D]|uniref:hypothetical protein n=1 Tax=Novosphingobium sp. PC22D TaxID=1962403 RepID=UPI001145A15F|nr:hypothetical protein [Novosphingobium sp. PC22D]